MSPPRVIVIMPVRNEARSLPSVLGELARVDVPLDVLVVDDGSSDESAELARSHGATVLRHVESRGYGAALVTGYRHVIEGPWDVVVLCDGDGQHPPEAIPALLAALEQGADYALASRMIEGGGPRMTPARHSGSRIFSAIVRLMTGQKVADVTSGFVAMRRRVVPFMAEVTPADYPDANVIAELLLAGFRIEEVPVMMRARAHGQSMMNGLAPLWYVPRMTAYLARIHFKGGRVPSLPPIQDESIVAPRGSGCDVLPFPRKKASRGDDLREEVAGEVKVGAGSHRGPA